MFVIVRVRFVVMVSRFMLMLVPMFVLMLVSMLVSMLMPMRVVMDIVAMRMSSGSVSVSMLMRMFMFEVNLEFHPFDTRLLRPQHVEVIPIEPQFFQLMLQLVSINT